MDVSRCMYGYHSYVAFIRAITQNPNRTRSTACIPGTWRTALKIGKSTCHRFTGGLITSSDPQNKTDLYAVLPSLEAIANSESQAVYFTRTTTQCTRVLSYITTSAGKL